jgi:hypothetical protein
MYLRIKDGNITKNILEAIAAITDSATLKLREVVFDEERSSLSLPIERMPARKKKRFPGFLKARKHDKVQRVKSLITINNVTDCKIEEGCLDANLSTVLLMFGLKVEEDEVYLCSLEEDEGETCYSIEAKISSIDIEIRDEE